MIKKNLKRKNIKSLAVLCSGGDAPGMNAALRAIVRSGIYHGLEVHGVYKGYSGLLEGHIEKMNPRSVANIIQRGGTILKTDRCKAFFKKSARAEAANILRRKNIDALIVIGGDGSYAGAHLMCKENQYPVVGVPGTIDNDIFGSEYSIGFDTAVNTALDAIDKIRDTASSHDRVFLVEVMGRTSADIAIQVGVSGGAEKIIIANPNSSNPTDELVTTLKRSAKEGKTSSIVVVAEGGFAGSTYKLAAELKRKLKIDPKVAILGYIQRGGTPSARDRYMASIMGVEAVQALIDKDFDIAIGYLNGKISRIPLQKIIGKHNQFDEKTLKLAEILAL